MNEYTVVIEEKKTKGGNRIESNRINIFQKAKRKSNTHLALHYRIGSNLSSRQDNCLESNGLVSTNVCHSPYGEEKKVNDNYCFLIIKTFKIQLLFALRNRLWSSHIISMTSLFDS